MILLHPVMSECRIWHEYSVEENGSHSTSRKLKLMVPYDSDIIGFAIDHLRDEMFREFVTQEGIDYFSPFPELKESLYRHVLGCDTREEIRRAVDIDHLRLIIIPDYVVYNRYVIVGVKRTDGCEGCLIEALGQRDHMECPNGCLHDQRTCIDCEGDFNSDISD